MKSKLFLPLFAAVLMTVAVSCNKNEYDMSYNNHFVIRSAGYYIYDDEGYEFLFTCDKRDINSEIDSEPEGGWHEVLVPIECMVKKTQLNEKLSSYGPNFFYTWDNNNSFYSASDFASGYIYVDLDESKQKINYEIDGITVGGTHLSVKYQGSISKSDEFIHCWPNS